MTIYVIEFSKGLVDDPLHGEIEVRANDVASAMEQVHSALASIGAKADAIYPKE